MEDDSVDLNVEVGMSSEAGARDVIIGPEEDVEAKVVRCATRFGGFEVDFTEFGLVCAAYTLPNVFEVHSGNLV